MPADRLAGCVEAFSSALRDKVRAVYPLPETERIDYEVVGDKPWSGFNYYLATTAPASPSTPISNSTCRTCRA